MALAELAGPVGLQQEHQQAVGILAHAADFLTLKEHRSVDTLECPYGAVGWRLSDIEAWIERRASTAREHEAA